jgi:hypothetical protein
VHFVCLFHRSDLAEVLPSQFAGLRRDASRVLGGIARCNGISQVEGADMKIIPPIVFE